MVDEGPHGYWIILLTFLAAYVLAVLPLPGWALWARPEWVALVLIYWTIALPQRVGMATGLALGIGLDVLEGAVIGQNAFSLVIVSLLALVLYQRLRVYNLFQQASLVFVLIGINQLVCQWVQNLEGAGDRSLLFLLPALLLVGLWRLVRS